jgi:hypothetical protein
VFPPSIYFSQQFKSVQSSVGLLLGFAIQT